MSNVTVRLYASAKRLTVNDGVERDRLMEEMRVFLQGVDTLYASRISTYCGAMLDAPTYEDSARAQACAKEGNFSEKMSKAIRTVLY